MYCKVKTKLVQIFKFWSDNKFYVDFGQTDEF